MTMYPLMSDPLVRFGATHETTLAPSALDVAVAPVGAPGTPAGTTASDATEYGEVPREFVAETLNVYEVPLVKLSTVHVVEMRPQLRVVVQVLPVTGFPARYA
jgi:hypothetical protein